MDFHIFVDGVEKFLAVSTSATLPEANFDFDVSLLEGSIVDFVLGNGAVINLFGDESLLNAMIFTDYDEFLPSSWATRTATSTSTLSTGWQYATIFNGDFSHRSLRTAYAHGDLNGDLQNDEYDFALFKQAYEGAHGPGSFAAMRQVPEPDACAIAGVIVSPAVSRRAVVSVPIFA